MKGTLKYTQTKSTKGNKKRLLTKK